MAEKRFLGKAAIVTGGNSGIGKAAALRFAIEGANVAIIGRDAITGEATVAEIKAAGGHASFHMADVGKSSEVESAMRAILSTYDQSAYCASKHAVVGLTKSVALEYAEQGIRINAVCPGGVATPMLKKYLRLLTPEKRTALEHPPIGRMANSNEIANMVAWLCSDEASYVIGQSYAVDGGFTVR